MQRDLTDCISTHRAEWNHGDKPMLNTNIYQVDIEKKTDMPTRRPNGTEAIYCENKCAFLALAFANGVPLCAKCLREVLMLVPERQVHITPVFEVQDESDETSTTSVEFDLSTTEFRV